MMKWVLFRSHHRMKVFSVKAVVVHRRPLNVRLIFGAECNDDQSRWLSNTQSLY